MNIFFKKKKKADKLKINDFPPIQQRIEIRTKYHPEIWKDRQIQGISVETESQPSFSLRGSEISEAINWWESLKSL